MKKIGILLVAFAAIVCCIYYQQALQAQRAEELIWAAYDGDLIGVKNALENGSPLHYVMYISDPARHYQSAEFTPLLAAASGGNAEVIAYLIKQGQNPAQRNIQGWTPLFVAIRDGHAQTAIQLLQAGVDPNVQTDTGASPLLLAVVSDFPSEEQRLSLLEYLLKREADPNLYTRWQTDPLYYAVTENKNPAVVQTLLKYKANPCRVYQGKTLPDLARADEKSAALLPLLHEACTYCSTAQTQTKTGKDASASQ